MKFKILPSDTHLSHFTIQEDELGKRMANFQEFQNTIQDFTFYTSSSLKRGRWRVSPMFVIGGERILYVATNPEQVKGELVKFFADLSLLLRTELSIRETFFYASLLHLIFLNIHPLNDGNGRTARLLEKWFLASKLGDKAWQIPSEKYYYNNKNEYYHNLQRIGFEYDTMDYRNALPFVNMLTGSIGV